MSAEDSELCKKVLQGLIAASVQDDVSSTEDNNSSTEHQSDVLREHRRRAEKLGNFKRMMKSLKASGLQDDVPSTEHQSFVPRELRSNVVLMTSQPLQQEDMATVFLGTTRPNFTEEMWK
jgi:hypothetical protein